MWTPWLFWIICLNPPPPSFGGGGGEAGQQSIPGPLDECLCLSSTSINATTALLRIGCSTPTADVINGSQMGDRRPGHGIDNAGPSANQRIRASPVETRGLRPTTADTIDRSIIAPFNLTLASRPEQQTDDGQSVVSISGDHSRDHSNSAGTGFPDPAPCGVTHRLNLSGCGITSIDKDAFDREELASVLEVDLSMNMFRQLDLGVFGPLQSLRVLNLTGNLLDRLSLNESDHEGRCLSKVRILDVSSNVLTQLPELLSANFTNFEALLVVNVSGNRMKTLDRDQLSRLPRKLSHLDLSHNQLTDLDPLTFACDDLSDLDLSHNLLTALKNFTFVNLYRLTSIDLSHNAIADFEVDAFFTWQGRKWCNGTFNLTSTSATGDNHTDTTLESCSLNRWPALELLDLSHNSLTGIRESTFRKALCGVRELRLGHNRIAHLPRYVVEQLRCLNHIDLQHNDIFWLDVGIFTNPSLRTIDLSFNKLRKVISMAFLYLPSVVLIDLSNNEIGYMYKYAFYRLCKDDQRSIHISLRANRLQTDGLWKMMSLFQHQENSACSVTVDLRDNHVTHFLGDAAKQVQKEITMVEMKRFHQWQKVTVDLNGNDIQCDCSTAEELNMLSFVDRFYPFGNLSLRNNMDPWKRLNCSGPPSLDGVTVAEFLALNRCPQLTKFSCPAACDCHVDMVSGIKAVNCSGRGLSDFPSFPVENMTEVDLSYNDLTELTSSDEMRLQFLRSLDLSHNRLRIISRDAILQLSSLELLLLNDNELESIPTEIGQMEKLSNMSLRGNPFSCTCHDVWIPEVVIRMRHVINDFALIRCSDGSELSRGIITRAAICAHKFQPFGSVDSVYRSNSRILIVLVGILPIAGVAIIVTVYRHQTRTAASSSTPDRNVPWSKVETPDSNDIFLVYCAADEYWLKNHLLDVVWNQFPRCSIRFYCDPEPPENVSRYVDESRITLIVTSVEFFRSSSWTLEPFRTTLLEKISQSQSGRFLIIGCGKVEQLEETEFRGQLRKVSRLSAGDCYFVENLVQLLAPVFKSPTEKYDRVYVEESDEEDQRLEKY